MGLDQYLLFFLLALISEIIGTVSGFGSSILFVPIASMFFNFLDVLGITAVFHVFSNVSKILLFKQGVDRRIVVKLGLPAILFVLIGAALTTVISSQYMELFMNIILVFLSLYLIKNFNKSLPANDANLYFGGAISGFLAGFIGSGGAIRGLTLSAFGLTKNVFIATSASIDLGVDFSRAIVYWYNGYIAQKYLILFPFLIFIGFIGSYIGKIILKYTSEIIFRYVVLVVIILTAGFQIYKLLFL